MGSKNQQEDLGRDIQAVIEQVEAIQADEPRQDELRDRLLEIKQKLIVSQQNQPALILSKMQHILKDLNTESQNEVLINKKNELFNLVEGLKKLTIHVSRYQHNYNPEKHQFKELTTDALDILLGIRHDYKKGLFNQLLSEEQLKTLDELLPKEIESKEQYHASSYAPQNSLIFEDCMRMLEKALNELTAATKSMV